MPADGPSWHFGVLSFTGTGHLNPLIALGQELARRGHRVTFFERPKIRERIEQAGLAFVPVGRDRSRQPPQAAESRAGLLAELTRLRINVRCMREDVDRYLQETPAALRRAGVDALIVNEIALTGPTLAQLLRLPYCIVCTSVPHHCGWSAYPWYAGYRFTQSPVGFLQRSLLEVSAVRMRGPIRFALNKFRKSAGLEPTRGLPHCYPPVAHITQLPACLEFPATRRSAEVHYTAPFVSRGARPAQDFPWDRLDGRPLAYASLGTTRNARGSILRMIAEACDGLDLQLVISLGGRLSPESFADLPGHPLIVSFAPQLELLRWARVVITHGGSNTVFESLMEGKPMVVIPLAHDQPAVAARVARAGAARVLPVMRLSTYRIRVAVMAILEHPAYGEAALNLQQQLHAIHGVERAADILEEALRSHRRKQSTVARVSCNHAHRVSDPRVRTASCRSL